MNGRDTYQWKLFITQATEATSKTNCPERLFLIPYLEKLQKILPPKVEKPTYGTELCHHANFHADWHKISVPGQNIHIFPYRDSGGGYHPMLYIFRKLLSR